MYNAALAINALGIEYRYDQFHEKTIIGFSGAEVTHEVKPLVGELTDNTLMRLRMLISSRFNVDLDDKPIYDAVKALALTNCFDPVLDMLSAAQAGWDKTPHSTPGS